MGRLQMELNQFKWSNLKIFHVQILIPLVLKLEELSGQNQELQTGTIKCITTVSSKLYLNDIKGVHTTLIIVLKQIRVLNSATTIPYASEELKLAAVECMATQLQRATTDTLEQFYTKDSSSLLGQILLTLVEFIEHEKYKKLIIASLHCLMTIFYVHDEADLMDVVLRSQVADISFIFLPKVVTVLAKTSLAEEKMGDTVKATAVKALGRILSVMYEETNEDFIKHQYSSKEFQDLVLKALIEQNESINTTDAEILGINKNKNQLEERMAKMQIDGRTKKWIGASSRKMRVIFEQTKCLRSHSSNQIRKEYANMCCTLVTRCAHNLKDNFLLLLENVVALAEDEDSHIKKQCQEYLLNLQCDPNSLGIFDECADQLFEIHLAKFPRVILRSQDDEQYAELLFLKGFFHNLSEAKLQLLFALPKNVENFGMCLLEAASLCVTRELMHEEYALRHVFNSMSVYNECAKLPWRNYKHLNTNRCVRILCDICGILGGKKNVNQIILNHFINLIQHEDTAMNEIILLMLWLVTENVSKGKFYSMELVDTMLQELFNDKHWHLALHPDPQYRLKPDKPASWFIERTPGLYESAVEVRTQDCDSDDEADKDLNIRHVTLCDAQYNVLHTCIILDALGHCAIYLGENFNKYVFRCLHKVLLKLAHSNSMVHQAAYFALISIQLALKYDTTTQMIDAYTDYISFHLNSILKRSPESNAAVDILSAVLQFSTRHSVLHLDSVFQTIQIECTKTYQTANVVSYLKVFNAFLLNILKWKSECSEQVIDVHMQIDLPADDGSELLENWQEILERPKLLNEKPNYDAEKEDDSTEMENNEIIVDALPRHIETIKTILNQVLKFVSASKQSHQILSLECLISGIPLLKDYENELLPLVHSIWQPLVEKFRQKDAIVLNRCFVLLNTLGTCAKEFILKRSLDNVIPFLKQFLKDASIHSATETSKAKTQEYKLQIILLQDFPGFIQNLQIDGKHLNEIVEITTMYLNKRQPKELQELALNFFQNLQKYNGPLIYVAILKKEHLPEYKENIHILLKYFGLK